ncbi:hypothetical protein M8J76_006525 [Diaphorina citri]|nr:hypothetical protein M8J76_006525 [Diaphorina citri]
MDEQTPSSIISRIKNLLDGVELKPSPGKTDFESCLENCVVQIYEQEKVTNVLIEKYFADKSINISIPSNARWKFIIIGSYLLLQLKDKLESLELQDVKETLLSVNEEQELKRCVEICISLGLIGSLLPGIGIPVEKRSKHFGLLKSDEPVDIIENYDRLSFITKVLSQLFNSSTTLKSIVLVQHLGDYLSALFQLSYTPLLKPGASNKQKSFTMSEEFYTRLVHERHQFKTMLSQLLSSVNQTDLLKQIMLLFGYCIQTGAKKHVWFMNACTNILNETLNKSNGIEILLKAMCDEDYTSPLVWRKLDIIAKIIATMKSSYHVTCPQVLQMLEYSDQLIQSSDQIKLNNQFSIAMCKHFYQHDPDVFHTFIFNHVISPIAGIYQEPKGNLSNCLTVLNRLFSHVEGLPREILLKYLNRLFFIYVNIYESPLFIPGKIPLENLLCTLLGSFPVEQCGVILNKLIFQKDETQCSVENWNGEVQSLDEDDIDENEQSNSESCIKLSYNMLDFPTGRIQVSPSGDLSYVNSPESADSPIDDNYEKYGACNDLDRNVVNVKLLNDLVQDIPMENFVSTNPEHIIMFIEFLIKQAINTNEQDPCTDNTDSLCTGLTLLNIIMTDRNASLFLHITSSLETLINQSSNEEVLLLARQILEQIKASNVNTSKHSRGSKLSGESYEKAMRDACDTLLPVRAHGIVVLTKLILSGDATAKANKNALLCLFMENLSDEDSYLYLSAVDGLAALASEQADTVVDTLTQHFTSATRQLELRLKLGEVLMRVARHLGEMLTKYKSYFLNAFLHGCKDEDHLLRASSLSNLAEICRILGYRVGSILSEIFICIKCIISSDPCPEPRRAAVMVASFLLCGLKHEALQVLEPILPELYRTLKHIYDNDPDDRTRLHAQLALEQLNEAVKTFFTPSLPSGFASLRL